MTHQAALPRCAAACCESLSGFLVLLFHPADPDSFPTILRHTLCSLPARSFLFGLRAFALAASRWRFFTASAAIRCRSGSCAVSWTDAHLFHRGKQEQGLMVQE